MMKRVIIYGLIAAVIYFIIMKQMEKSKYMKFLHELGFGIADFMSPDEVKTSYLYLHDYAQKHGTNASQALKVADPALWMKAKRIADKYKIFQM